MCRDAATADGLHTRHALRVPVVRLSWGGARRTAQRSRAAEYDGDTLALV